MQRDLTHASV